MHEAYLKLVDQSRAGWQDLAHFRALASLAMRHVLVDRARERCTLKRGGVRRQITLDDEMMAAEDQPAVLLQLNDALERLATVEPRLALAMSAAPRSGNWSELASLIDALLDVPPERRASIIEDQRR